MTKKLQKNRTQNCADKFNKRFNDAVVKFLKHKKAITVVLSFVTLICIWLFGFFATPSNDAVQTLMDLNVALLGFFGVYSVYIYTSYDTRISKLDIQIKCHKVDVEYAEGNIKDRFNELINVCTSEVEGLKLRRNRISRLIMLSASFLLLSLVFSLTLLGSMYTNLDTTSRTSLLYFSPVSSTGTVLLYAILLCLTLGIIAVFTFILTVGRKYPTDEKQNGNIHKIETPIKTPQANNTANKAIGDNSDDTAN